MPLLLGNDGYIADIDSQGIDVSSLHYTPLLRYFVSRIRSLKIQSGWGFFVESTLLTKFYNLTHLCIYNMSKLKGEDLQKLSCLTSLDLSFNIFRPNEGYKDLSLLTGLRNLVLSHSMIISDEGICRLTNLKLLDLTHNDSITDRGISSLVNLESLSIGHNKKITMAGVSLLTNLTLLDMRTKGFNVLDGSSPRFALPFLTKLRTLVVHNPEYATFLKSTRSSLENVDVL